MKRFIEWLKNLFGCKRKEHKVSGSVKTSTAYTENAFVGTWKNDTVELNFRDNLVFSGSIDDAMVEGKYAFAGDKLGWSGVKVHGGPLNPMFRVNCEFAIIHKVLVITYLGISITLYKE